MSGLVFASEVGAPLPSRDLERAWYRMPDKTREAWRAELKRAGRSEEPTCGPSAPRARWTDPVGATLA